MYVYMYVRVYSQVLPATIVSSESVEFRVEDVKLLESAGESLSPGDQDSGISLQIPSWKGPTLVSVVL